MEELNKIPFKPSLAKVMKDLKNFDYELQMFCYHKLNGRDDEAQSHLDTYKNEQSKITEELKINVQEIKY